MLVKFQCVQLIQKPGREPQNSNNPTMYFSLVYIQSTLPKSNSHKSKVYSSPLLFIFYCF